MAKNKQTKSRTNLFSAFLRAQQTRSYKQNWVCAESVYIMLNTDISKQKNHCVYICLLFFFLSFLRKKINFPIYAFIISALRFHAIHLCSLKCVCLSFNVVCMSHCSIFHGERDERHKHNFFLYTNDENDFPLSSRFLALFLCDYLHIALWSGILSHSTQNNHNRLLSHSLQIRNKRNIWRKIMSETPKQSKLKQNASVFSEAIVL